MKVWVKNCKKTRSSFPIYDFLRPALLWATAQTIMNQKSKRKFISFAKKSSEKDMVQVWRRKNNREIRELFGEQFIVGIID